MLKNDEKRQVLIQNMIGSTDFYYIFNRPQLCTPEHLFFTFFFFNFKALFSTFNFFLSFTCIFVGFS